MRQRIDLDALWRQAAKLAALDIAAAGRRALGMDVLASSPCPLSLGDIVADEARPDDLVQRIAAALKA